MDRRRFLQASSAAFAIAALGATACDRDDDSVDRSNDDERNGADLGPPLGTAGDRAVLAGAFSLESTAVDVYDQLLESDALAAPTQKALRESVRLLRDHHERNRDAVEAALRDRRSSAVSTQHDGLRSRIGKQPGDASSREDVLAAAAAVETAAAATYTLRSTELDEPELRGLLLAFAAIDAGHATLVRLEQAQPPLRSDPHWPTNDALALEGD